MHTFKTIIVGLELTGDGKAITDGSRMAVRQAIWVAKANGGAIQYLHSTYNDEYRGAVSAHQSVVHSGLSDDGSAALEAIVAETSNAGVESRLIIREDRAWLEIIHAAMDSSADLVVVGKRDSDSNDGRKLGNVAVKLLRKCPTAVWVVKPDHDQVHGIVLAATDLEPVGDLAVRYGSFVAKRHNAELHVVHAWGMPLALQMRGSRINEAEFDREVKEIDKKCIAHIEEVLAACDLSQSPHIHTTMGSPASTIGDAVTHLSPDLLVMGTVSRAGLAGILVGSTAERLLGRVDCSILAVKPDDFVCPIGKKS